MEPMKPDAVNAGHPKYNVGDLVYWCHDMFLGKYEFVRAPSIILQIPSENNNNYVILALNTGYNLICTHQNLFDHEA